MMWSIKVYVTLLETTVVVVSVGGVGWFAEAFSCQNLLPLRLGWAFEDKQRILSLSLTANHLQWHRGNLESQNKKKE